MIANEEVEVIKTGEDSYHVSANTTTLHLDEDVDGPKLMGMTGLTMEELFRLFDLKPIGHKTTITRK